MQNTVEHNSHNITLYKGGDTREQRNKAAGCASLFINKRFALNEMFQQNASKFAILYV